MMTAASDHSTRAAPQPRPLRLEVLAYAPTAFYHCTHCEVVFQHVGLGEKIHAEQDAAAFPDDLRRDYLALSSWVRRLVDRLCGQVDVKVVDAASLEGVWKALRYRARRFPCLIAGGRAYPLGDFARADALVDDLVRRSAGGSAEAPTPPKRTGENKVADLTEL